MPPEIAKKAIDFVIARSGVRHNIEVDFFGGEPLMAWDTVTQTVDYARSLEEKYNKMCIRDSGHAGNKTANKTTAAVGDTITYSIRLENGAAATADWENMTVTDTIPDGVTFAGNVQENGSATVNYSYNADTKTITFTPDAIAAGAQTVLSFDVTVDDGSQGKFIVNTCLLYTSFYQGLSVRA